MNNKFISFDSEIIEYPNYFYITFTNKMIESLQSNGYSYSKFAYELSMINRFILIPIRYDSQIIFNMYVNDGLITCIINENNQILATGYKKINLYMLNKAMKSGINFVVHYKFVVTIRYKIDNFYQSIWNGQAYDPNTFSRNISVDICPQNILKQLIYKELNKEIGVANFEQDINSQALEDYLDLAENYAALSLEMEKRKQIESSSVYLSVQLSDYERNDRIAYSFKVDSITFDEQIFSIGTQVEFELEGNETIKGEIVKLIKDKEDEYVTDMVVLFFDQVDFSRFPSVGRYSLTLNNVSYNVQTNAIENIRKRKASAKYMNAILGNNKPEGFDNTDTSYIESYENAKEYPPNQSQMDAIKKGIQTKDIFLVMGPPGTGKTTVILAWIKHFVEVEKKRVLVSSKNNKAVDNVLERVRDNNTEIIRIGSEAKIQEQVKEYTYEKRIGSLRNKIAERTNTHTEYLDELIATWKSYADMLSKLIVLYEQEEQEKIKFENKKSQIFIPAYNAILQQLNQISYNRKKRYELSNLLRTYYANILKYENSKSGIYRFFAKIGYISNLKKIQLTTREYRQLYEGGMQLAESYRELYCHFYEAYGNLYQFFLSGLYNVIKTKEYVYANVINMPLNDIRNIWNLYVDAYQRPINTKESVMSLYDYIQNETQRANVLKDIISEWNNYVAEKQNYALGSIILESVDVVGATCIGINSNSIFNSLKFDIAIIDEAGQIQIHDALVPMSVAPKVIMLGDHKQIPPSVDQELIELCKTNDIDYELLEKSLFEKLYIQLPNTNKTILDTQYRMPGEIADTISDWFYEKKYKSPDFKRNLKGKMPFSKSPYVIIDTSYEESRFERKIENAGCDNELEAKIVADIINYVAKDEDTNLKEIGIISAYKAQVKLIKRKLCELNNVRITPFIKEMVNSLDSYQGQERDIIIYSFTKSSRLSVNRRRIGFLCELRRLNVALTRAKKTLVLIGDMSFLATCDHIETDSEGNEIYEKSEREFGDFIKKMIQDVSENGEILTYNMLKERMLGV